MSHAGNIGGCVETCTTTVMVNVSNQSQRVRTARADNAASYEKALSEEHLGCHHGTVKDANISPVLKNALSDSRLSSTGDDELKSAIFYDLDETRATFRTLLTSFGPHFLHAIAIKANPITGWLKEAVQHGMGCECASISEVKHSMAAGCPPHRVVFDSPAKTMNEICFCLEHGIHINVNSFDELERIASLRGEGGKFSSSSSTIGLRMNALVGKGTIGKYSVSTARSKFGVPLTPENRKLVCKTFERYPWMNALHVHVGSQGTSADSLATGARMLSEFADEIDSYLGEDRIQLLDIGGGLYVNFADDKNTPSFAEYAALLKEKAPALFDGRRLIVTEFGRSASCKSAFFVSNIEYMTVVHGADEDADDSDPSVISDEVRLLTVHAGADLFMRPCYCPNDYQLRCSVYDGDGTPANDEQFVTCDVVGPLCFAGDKVCRGRLLPAGVKAGGWLVLHDAGANTMSLWSRHCSRMAPAVYGYEKAVDGTTQFSVLKGPERCEDVIKFWTGNM